jgi:P27 family predicted phage terminase small subunit
VPNKPQKPVDQLQFKRGDRAERRTLLLPVTTEPRPIPRCPAGLQPGAQRRWRAYWSAPVAAAVDLRSDAEAVERWVHCVSERERLQPLADKTPLVKGSTGQLVANPLYGVINGLSREIERLEEHLGMTPLARMRLGLVQTQRDIGVADLRRRLERAGEATDAIEAEATEVVDLDEMG